eukprot:CAMPEP_0196728140 /NCGR_PEP_ID=MMETSP1091-20130531/8915_1 /TAXON_ID=302021 /ORGANISM="Rhodomonas sp., Strain CCMP768" /LENGTH=131 /DNA_ID=CAMNT_0042070847 /DNA_START=1 /DNA_END=394 /DNA_ORIENTATION=-
MPTTVAAGRSAGRTVAQGVANCAPSALSYGNCCAQLKQNKAKALARKNSSNSFAVSRNSESLDEMPRRAPILFLLLTTCSVIGLLPSVFLLHGGMDVRFDVFSTFGLDVSESLETNPVKQFQSIHVEFTPP